MNVSRGALIEVGIMALALAAALLPVAPETIERWFSTGLYPPFQRRLTSISNAAPFALFDVLTVAAVVATGTTIFRAAQATRRTRHASPTLRAVRHLATGAAVVYLVFLSLWGFNYRRVAMTERLELAEAPPSDGAVVALGLDAASMLNRLHARAQRLGWRQSPLENNALRAAFMGVQRALTDAPAPELGRLKRSVYGPYFRWASVDGMINPFGLEVLANPDLLPFERPFVAAHEWAHLAGYADEGEASFVGWLACIRADVPAQYSGWLFMYWQVRAETSEEGRQRLAATLAEGPRADLDAVAARIRRGQLPWLRTAGWQVYDRYLKVNRVEEGVRSYGTVVTLVLRGRFQEPWTPVRRGAGGPHRPPGS
jgi:hypothetical protein